MGATSIEWADYTFNPWIGCEKVSAGCKNCYASVDTYARVSASRGLPLWGPGSTRHRTSESYWKHPRAWNRKAVHDNWYSGAALGLVARARPRVFCASLADVFEGRADLDPWREDLFDVIEECTELDWLVLTKRPANVCRMVPDWWLRTLDDCRCATADGCAGPRAGWPSHVWIGTSVENQEAADERIPHLLQVPAPVRFLSLEPLLGPVDLEAFLSVYDRHGEPSGPRCREDGRRVLDWLIVGGESGSSARPCEVDWIRGLVQQGKEAGVATFVKQLGSAYSDRVNGVAGRSLSVPREAAPLVGRRLSDGKGGDMSEWPEDLRVREIPEVYR